MTRPTRIAIAGAGPSGLAAAHRIVERSKGLPSPPEVLVLDGSSIPGGGIGTDAIDGFLVERGADGFITDKPALLDLSARLGITDRLIRTLPATQGAFVVRGGRLLPIPAGFSMMAPTQLRTFLASPLISPRGKLRAAAEMLLPRGEPRGDESLASFVRRRFGDEVLEWLAQPLVGGIYGADPETLSLRATMPRFLEEERSSRSVTLGLRRKARRAAEAAQGARYSLFASFDRGMQVLVDALCKALPGGTLRLGCALEAVSFADGQVQLATSRGPLQVDHLILALPSRVSCRLLEATDGVLAHRLAGVEHGSCATVNLGFSRRVHEQQGYGVVIPTAERRPAIAFTFASRKWADRAPEGADLIRVFLGDTQAEELDEDALVRLARGELQALLGVHDEPRFAVVRRHVAAMPRYHVGHLDRVAAVERRVARLPWLSLAGNSLRGVGIPDAVRSGEDAADRALAARG